MRRTGAAALLLTAAPQVARAHGGGLELVVPLWPTFALAFLWFLLGWRARARAKVATLAAVTAAWWVGAFAAAQLSDSSEPLEVARSFALGTVLLPAVVWVVAWRSTRWGARSPPAQQPRVSRAARSR